MRTTPTKPMRTATILRVDVRAFGMSTIVASTVAMGVVELPMPASAEETRVSEIAKSVNGNADRKNPMTIMCRHTRHVVGSRPPVIASSARTTTIPVSTRIVAIWIGVIASSPTFMNRKLDPQMRTRIANLTCHATRGVRGTPGVCRVVAFVVTETV
jgi:hypothetical protein